MSYVAVCDLTGPLAHFRKFYTNSSSLSYGFPPRTVLMGVVAAVLGWERDTYYEELGLQKARFAVVVKVPVRRIMQTVNYIRTKAEDLDRMRKLEAVGGTQVPLEFLIPAGESPHLKFRIYFTHQNQELVKEWALRVKTQKAYYPLYLGLTECIAQARFIYEGEPEAIHSPGEEVIVHSVLNARFLAKPLLRGDIALYREKAPFSFGPGRQLLPTASFIYEVACRPVPAVLSCTAYTFSLPDGRETIVFMEGDLWDTLPTEMGSAVTA